MPAGKKWGSTVFLGTMADWVREGPKERWYDYIIEAHPSSTQIKMWNTPHLSNTQKKKLANAEKFLGYAKQILGEEWDLTQPIPWQIISVRTRYMIDQSGAKIPRTFGQHFHIMWYRGAIRKFVSPIQFFAIWGIRDDFDNHVTALNRLIYQHLKTLPYKQKKQIDNHLWYLKRIAQQWMPPGRPVRNRYTNHHYVLDPQTDDHHRHRPLRLDFSLEADIYNQEVYSIPPHARSAPFHNEEDIDIIEDLYRGDHP